ncbi:MAG: hypothetical protein HZB55_02590 [Deltaproteobacteria bacterium]|nr:hypothetical protein [Deltaproteobacteria bacterium]
MKACRKCDRLIPKGQNRRGLCPKCYARAWLITVCIGCAEVRRIRKAGLCHTCARKAGLLTGWAYSISKPRAATCPTCGTRFMGKGARYCGPACQPARKPRERTAEEIAQAQHRETLAQRVAYVRLRTRVVAGLRRWRRQDPALKAEYKRRHRARHPERLRAERELRKALAAGLVTREPCGLCGAEHVEAHHLDYGRPLAVVWLCKACHWQHHRSTRLAARALRTSPPAPPAQGNHEPERRDTA